MMNYENIKERRAEVRYRVMSKSKIEKNPKAYLLASFICAMMAGLFTLTYDTRVLFVSALMALASVHCAYVAYLQDVYLKRKSLLELDN
jgi:hypothetical protein